MFGEDDIHSKKNDPQWKEANEKEFWAEINGRMVEKDGNHKIVDG